MAMLSNEDIYNYLNSQFGVKIKNYNTFRDLLTIDVYSEDAFHIISYIHHNQELDFPLLIDISGVDYLEYNDDVVLERFAVIYIFYSFKNDRRIKIRAFVPESNPVIHSIYSEYKGALWTEREVFDMYGIHFKSHPNLKRLLTPEDFGSHPLRKDYPLKGKGERSNFPKYNIYDKMNK